MNIFHFIYVLVMFYLIYITKVGNEIKMRLEWY